jgi:hypothetical protein
LNNDISQNDRLSQAIEARLVADERTRDAVIEVSAAAGEVTLRGAVDSEGIREAAEQIARSASGATLVINELAVTTSEQRAEVNTIPRVPLVPGTGGYGGGGFPGNSGQV